MATYDYTVIGGGIVGISTAYHLGISQPQARILLLEKEDGPAQHQTGRNSGVIHSGIYYKPGSSKARFAKDGARTMVKFCADHDIAHDVCGKVIVATHSAQIPQLENLYQRGLLNDVPVEKASPEQVREIEPHVHCVAAVLVKSTGITNYMEVCRKLLSLSSDHGTETRFNESVSSIREQGAITIVSTPVNEYESRFVINCAGLHSDRVARMAGSDPGARIVPFRGEYFELIPEKRHLVSTLVYPVPNPDFPFLGVHFTKMIDGSVHAGPNAVLALAREGYHKTDFNFRDFSETMTHPGFWTLIRGNLREGMKEMYRSAFKSAFVHSLQQLVPEIRSRDLIPCKAGVRAQALFDDGRLVDDFLMVRGRRTLHVCNAPSPAATAALEIGKSIVRQLS